tara:strand:- start:65 stop:277 length:213 start_codon:yes stop_codon:yes gene_type:complete
MYRPIGSVVLTRKAVSSLRFIVKGAYIKASLSRVFFQKLFEKRRARSLLCKYFFEKIVKSDGFLSDFCLK